MKKTVFRKRLEMVAAPMAFIADLVAEHTTLLLKICVVSLTVAFLAQGGVAVNINRFWMTVLCLGMAWPLFKCILIEFLEQYGFKVISKGTRRR
jgi:hypothetical protein